MTAATAAGAKPMKQLAVKIDRSIPTEDLARALATIGCMLSSDANGEMRVSKRRICKPNSPPIKAVRKE